MGNTRFPLAASHIALMECTCDVGPQVCTHSFFGLSREDLEVIMKYFSVLKFPQNTHIWTQGSDATSFALLLNGCGVYMHDEHDVATGVWNRQVVGYHQKGKNLELECSISNSCWH